jgi:hypothetical protein
VGEFAETGTFAWPYSTPKYSSVPMPSVTGENTEAEPVSEMHKATTMTDDEIRISFLSNEPTRL